MKELIRIAMTVWIAALVALSIALSPANATTMIDCDVSLSGVQVHDTQPDHSGHDSAGDHTGNAYEHPESHCANHTCVVAISTVQFVADGATLLMVADHDLSARSLIALTSPDGLRRPPRT